MDQALFRLPNLVPSRPLRVNIHDPVNRVVNPPKDLVRHEVAARGLLVVSASISTGTISRRRRRIRWRGLALTCRWMVCVTVRGREVRVDRGRVLFSLPRRSGLAAAATGGLLRAVCRGGPLRRPARRVARGVEVLLDTLGLHLAALEVIEQRLLLLELILRHVLLDALEDAVMQHAADNAGKLGALAHRLGEASAQRRRKLRCRNVCRVDGLAHLLNRSRKRLRWLRQRKAVQSRAQLRHILAPRVEV